MPFILLYWVNKIFMVASRTSDKLCLIYTKKGKEKKKTSCNEEQVDRIITLAIRHQKTKQWLIRLIFTHIRVIHLTVTPVVTAPPGKKKLPRVLRQTCIIAAPSCLIATVQIKPKSPEYKKTPKHPNTHKHCLKREVSPSS